MSIHEVRIFIIYTILLYLSDTFALKISLDKTFSKLSPWKLIDWQKLSKNRADAVTSTHPLRHPTWQIEIEAPGIDLPIRLLLKFHRDGKITTSNPNIAGHWQYGPYGIIYSLNTVKGEVYHFSAEICWNNYGESAFFRKGVIYSDRKGRFKFLFRPVHGKFSGKSIKNS
ncbi:conserved Plasmodium protein, unknown function [Babesia microti strain RI]|uniref:Uncharacterized protein n=1 Tax=Babesia microti (strain RI) TaxID=1133968 RepID=I7IG36_BABMR|nr:conserved Plasmodium protein, unknown function [Babesia microti strain RI]CCF73316.1 conserved Plasmodium protein, unknown function [Babesia microti strain RI]|eukprot:XP_012647925.1 conserved Plasmodium protein, unknown function [Babesia microti strain RI]